MAPSSWTIGPYEIVRPLGAGGFGAVYLGRHRESGLEVAVKTVNAPSARLVASLRDEIRSLRGLGHPGIVRILDDGVTREGPWYAMERIVGTSLLGYVDGDEAQPEAARPDSYADTRRLDDGRARGTREAGSLAPTGTFAMSGEHGTAAAPSGTEPGTTGGGAPPLTAGRRARIATVVRRLCGPLAYLHGEGIVHRDLKPENVVVRPDGQPVIVDFGLTSRAPGDSQRETMEAVGEVAGSVLYMAPEQVRGELLDARADLYALGCILYRLLTGAPPFESASPYQVLLQHLNSPPVPPSRICPDLDTGLEALVLRLLAKEPRRRPGHARDVAAALESLGALVEPLPGPEPRTYLYRAGLVGREGAMETLVEALEGLVRDGQGGLVLVGGDAGIGKTRLLKEAGRRAHDRGLRLVAEDCAPQATGSGVLRGFQKLLQDAADRFQEHAPQGSGPLAGHAPVLAPFVTGMRRVVESLDLAEAAPISADAAQLRLFRALEQVLASTASRAPTVAMLDDLHDADELTILALERMARTGFLARHALLILASHRSDARSDELQALARMPHVAQVLLEPLGSEHVAAIASDMLSLDPLPAHFGAFLARASEGNPFFVAQYLRTAVATGLLLRDDGGTWRMRATPGGSAESLEEALPLPSTLRDLALRKLSALSEPARGLLELASIHGRELPGALLDGVGGLTAGEREAALRELVTKRCLEERDALLRFRHGSLQEVAYASLDPSRLPELHRAAASSLGSLPFADPAGVARHWELGGEPRRALEGYRAAAMRAVERSAFREAERHYRACLRVEQTGDVETRVGLATAVRVLGRNAEAFALQREAHAIAVASGDPRVLAISLNSLGVLHHVSGNDDEARDVYESCVAVSRAAGLEATLGKALANLAVIHWNQGRLSQAEHCLQESIAIQRRVAPGEGEIVPLVNLGSLHVEQGRPGDAQTILRRALALARTAGAREAEGLVEANLATTLLVAGQLGPAEEGMRRALGIFRDIGARASEAHVMSTISTILLELGRLEEAFELASASLAITEEAAWGRALSTGHVNRGRAEHALGRLDEARASYEKSLACAGDTPLRQVEALVQLAILDLDEGRPEDARRRNARALELADAIGSAEASAEAHVGIAKHARATGRAPAEIRAALDAAERAYAKSAHRLGALVCLCERAQLAARCGDAEEARALATEAAELAASFGIGPRSPNGREVAAALAAAGERR